MGGRRRRAGGLCLSDKFHRKFSRFLSPCVNKVDPQGSSANYRARFAKSTPTPDAHRGMHQQGHGYLLTKHSVRLVEGQRLEGEERPGMGRDMGSLGGDFARALREIPFVRHPFESKGEAWYRNGAIGNRRVLSDYGLSKQLTIRLDDALISKRQSTR